MCGRFVSASPPDQIAAFFGAELASESLAPNWNVAPTNDIYAVVHTPDGPKVQAFRWGLVPAWAKDVKIGQKMINARSETLAAKPAFKTKFRKYRAIIPADGFYEWQSVPGVLNRSGKPAKQPMYIHRLDGEPLAFAGLWSVWRDKTQPDDGARLHSATIITTSANATMAPVHDRMPVILPANEWARWLDPANDDFVSLGGLLVPAADDLLTMHPVSTDVNSVRNKGPHLLAEVEPLSTDRPATGSLF